MGLKYYRELDSKYNSFINIKDINYIIIKLINKTIRYNKLIKVYNFRY